MRVHVPDTLWFSITDLKGRLALTSARTLATLGVAKHAQPEVVFWPDLLTKKLIGSSSLLSKYTARSERSGFSIVCSIPHLIIGDAMLDAIMAVMHDVAVELIVITILYFLVGSDRR